MKVQVYGLVFAVAALLAGCSHNGGTIPMSSTEELGNPSSTQTAVVHGNFTEYSLPAGVTPNDIARGPYNTLYFSRVPAFISIANATFYQMLDATGAIHTYNAPQSTGLNGAPAQLQNSQFTTSVISFGGAIYFDGIDGGMDSAWLVRMTPTGQFTFFPFGIDQDNAILNFVLGPDGRIWFPWNFGSSGIDNNVGHLSSISTNGVPGPGASFRSFFGQFVTPGPGGNFYITLVYAGPLPAPPPTNSFVYVVSPAGSILHKFPLPNNSNPFGIVTGSDHNLWIAEFGANKIARMTTSGVVTQYAIPTANSGPYRITSGYDDALWFTEQTANKIGRITTAGQITEYPVPTASSGLTAIVPCTTNCPPHGGVWFAEQKANKIGKFVSPL